MLVNLPGQTVPVSPETKLSPLKEATQEFESLFIGQLMEAMRRTAPQGGALSAGGGEQMFRQLFDQEIAQRMSQRGGIGIGEMLYKQVHGSRGEDSSRDNGRERACELITPMLTRSVP